MVFNSRFEMLLLRWVGAGSATGDAILPSRLGVTVVERGEVGLLLLARTLSSTDSLDTANRGGEPDGTLFSFRGRGEAGA
jgi:hypothetical protein